MQAELEIEYGAESKFLKTHDGEEVQVFWLPAAKRYLKHHGVDVYAASTMIICGPNAGYCEMSTHSSDWPDIYLDNGINVVLWNYRGYGMSTGTPTPAAIRKDVELVFKYAKEMTVQAVRGQRPVKIGVHGISMGGLAATHLGRSGAVDFMMVDRSFSDLEGFPRSVNRFLSTLLRLVTLWDNPLCSHDFLYSNCYKVVAQDPND